MSAERLAEFAKGVRECGWLSETQLLEIEQYLSSHTGEPEGVPRYFVKQGIITSFQAKLLWRGQGSDLLFNQYVLVEKIGEGGMGEVFRAKHTRLDRDVALKVMRRERLNHPEAVKRFRREIRAAAALAHENVVMAYDADQAGDVHFFAMEYVDGSNLAKMVIQKGALPIATACDYIRQTAHGLQHAHEKGLTHRDIKPANLLVTKTGTVKISDLGLARIDDVSGDDSVSRITKEGLVVGTPDYLSPEQARDSRDTDIRSDLYSLGCTLYYLLSADVPFPGGTPTEKMLRHSREPIPPIRRTDMPAGLEKLMVKLTAKKREQRFQTPSELAAALEEFIPSKPTQLFLTPAPLPITEAIDDEPQFNKRRVFEQETDSRFRLPSGDALPSTPRRTDQFSLMYVAIALMVFGVLLVGVMLILMASR